MKKELITALSQDVTLVINGLNLLQVKPEYSKTKKEYNEIQSVIDLCKAMQGIAEHRSPMFFNAWSIVVIPINRKELDIISNAVCQMGLLIRSNQDIVGKENLSAAMDSINKLSEQIFELQAKFEDTTVDDILSKL